MGSNHVYHLQGFPISTAHPQNVSKGQHLVQLGADSSPGPAHLGYLPTAALDSWKHLPFQKSPELENSALLEIVAPQICATPTPYSCVCYDESMQTSFLCCLSTLGIQHYRHQKHSSLIYLGVSIESQSRPLGAFLGDSVLWGQCK